MPILRNAESVSFALPGLEVRGLASPRRGSRETAVWQITLAPRAPGFPHAVTREEIFVALAGSARVVLDGQTHDLAAGDTLIVPPGTEFALSNPSADPFEAIVSFPVGGQAVTAEGTFTPPWAE